MQVNLRPGIGIILVLLCAVGYCQADISWIGLQPKASTKGLSIYGVQCGASYKELLAKLPKNWKISVASEGEHTAIQDDRGRHIIVALKKVGQTEKVRAISVFPVTDTLSVELDGVQVLKGKVDLSTIRKKLGSQGKALEQGRLQFRKGNQCLNVTFGGPDDSLFQVSLLEALGK